MRPTKGLLIPMLSFGFHSRFSQEKIYLANEHHGLSNINNSKSLANKCLLSLSLSLKLQYSAKINCTKCWKQRWNVPICECVCGQRRNRKKRLFTFFFSVAQLWEFAKPENAYDGSTKLVKNTEFEQRFNSAIFDFVGTSFLCQFENNSLGISLVSFKAFLS